MPGYLQKRNNQPGEMPGWEGSWGQYESESNREPETIEFGSNTMSCVIRCLPYIIRERACHHINQITKKRKVV
jgi:hypothetical protein